MQRTRSHFRWLHWTVPQKTWSSMADLPLDKIIADPLLRLNNLYQIVGKDGVKQMFHLNWCQKQLYDSMWYLNCILKSRQLGLSTFCCLLFLVIAVSLIRHKALVSCVIIWKAPLSFSNASNLPTKIYPKQ